MRWTLVLVALVMAAAQVAWAGPRSAQKAFRTIQEVCWPQERIRALKCDIEKLSEAGPAIQEFYHRGNLQRMVLDPMTMGQSSMVRGVAGVGRKMQRLLSGSGESCSEVRPGTQICQSPVTVEEEFSLFKRLLAERAKAIESQIPAAARDCYRACLVKCAVSELISYNERENQEDSSFVGTRFFAGPEQIWSDGTGECSEIATLATALGEGLGISIRNVSTMVHEFNQVKLGARTYSMDASSPGCTFFEDFR